MRARARGAQKAARVAEAALTVDPSSADATLRRAFASAAASAFDGAVADAEKAAALAPGDARVAAARARVLAMRDEAFAATERDGKNEALHAFAPKIVPGPAVSAPLNKQPVPLFHARSGPRARSTRPCRRAPPPPRARSPPRRRRASARRTASSA